MVIDSTNIADFGLKVQRAIDLESLPMRKRILTTPGLTANDIKHEPQRITVKLFGAYADRDTLALNLHTFRELIEAELVHDVVLVGRKMHFTAVATRGFQVNLLNNVMIVELELTIVENLEYVED